MAINVKSFQCVRSDDFLWDCSIGHLQVQLDLPKHVPGGSRRVWLKHQRHSIQREQLTSLARM